MNIRLVRKQSEENGSATELQQILDTLSSLYSNEVSFKYDADQSAVLVMKSGRVLGTVRAEGALHTIVWATLSIAEKEA